MSLNIAFFGSDAFSVAALRRLAALARSHPRLVAHIDVYTRSVKPTGRSLKRWVDVPLGAYATQHALPLHRVDCARDIAAATRGRGHNLAVAVSFGRLIPGPWLQSLRYGGLNVHPSMLPQYSGAAPIQHALMDDRTATGVTVQTLHPTQFDRGAILRRSPPVPISPTATYRTLEHDLAAVGADLLAAVLRDGAYVDAVPLAPEVPFSPAPKITPARAEVRWGAMTSRQIRRLADALGPVHSYKSVDVVRKKTRVQDSYKVIFDDLQEASASQALAAGTPPGGFALENGRLVVKTADAFVSIGKAKLQYCGLEDAPVFVGHLRKRTGDTPRVFGEKRSTPVGA